MMSPLVATFSQGIVLGTFVQGIPVAGRDYAGGSFGWLTPFAMLTGAGLVVGYALLGACWLVLKTEGGLQAWARRKARHLAAGVAAFVAMVSLWTPFIQPQIRSRWFGGDHPLWLWPVPLILVTHDEADIRAVATSEMRIDLSNPAIRTLAR